MPELVQENNQENNQEQQENKQEQLKEVGVHRIKIKKYLSEDGEQLVCGVELSDGLKELISTFVVKGQFSFEEFDGMKVKRHKIKSVLRNSHSWSNCFSHFFSKKCVDTGSFDVNFSNSGTFQSFVSNLRYFKDLIKLMEELRREETMVVSYKLER